MSLRLLAVGDVHLGRRPSRLPEELAGESRALGPAGAWQTLVDIAISENVDAVALAGDVVEGEEDFYEAYRELDAGIKRLVESGTRVAGVSGNHDVHVLPRLADQLADFTLLGRGGAWQTLKLTAGGESLVLHGWSFPRDRVHASPLEGVRLRTEYGVNLGLLHCDRDRPGSIYAPVASSELAAAGLDGWLLGHIHLPDPLDAANPAGYLGCISGMDPGEADDHGPWLLTVERGRIQSFKQWVIAPLRWETLELDLSALGEPDEARALLLERIRERDGDIGNKKRPPRAVGLRVRLVGRTGFGRRVQELFRDETGEIIFDATSGRRYFIERVVLDTRPVLPLEELARRDDPPGLLARRLCLLEHPQGKAARELVASARRRLERLRSEARWRALHGAPLDDASTSAWLQSAGIRLLEAMLAQQGNERQ